MNKYMEQAIENARTGVVNKEGGPFGAVIIDKEGNVISSGNNRVLIDKDPTSHAEIVAIREACKKLNTSDLSECTIYTTSEPCPMCLSATIWANIKKVYYGCSKEDAANIGFRDNAIYEFIKGNNNMISINQMDRENCIKIMRQYKDENRTIY